MLYLRAKYNQPKNRYSELFIMVTFHIVRYFRAKYNQPNNRYSDVLCYDHSRVHLPPEEDDPSSDYINANFVDGYMQKDAYICTQGTWQCLATLVSGILSCLMFIIITIT